MLLRRFIQHVSDQNWFAVAIDLVIVVFGVFIGIQVSNWNNERVALAEEEQLVARVGQEFLFLNTELGEEVRVLFCIQSHTGSLIESLRKEQPDANVLEFSQQLWAASSLPVLPPAPAVATEMVSSGSLSRLSRKELRRQITLYLSAIDAYGIFQPQALATVYPPNSKFFEAVKWSTDTNTWAPRTAQDAVIAYNLEKLREAEGELQQKQLMQYDVWQFAQVQLEITEEILRQAGVDVPTRPALECVPE